MTDRVYDIKKPWQGADHILEVASQNYLEIGEMWSQEKMEKAARALRDELLAVFGDKTDEIIGDPEAIGDADADGFIDINIKHIFSKYFENPNAPVCAKILKTSRAPDTNAKGFLEEMSGVSINPYTSVQDLKSRMLDTFAESGRLYFSEYFADSLYRGKRWSDADSKIFKFDRYDLDAARNYFASKYGGGRSRDDAWIHSLSGDIERYFAWAAVHPKEGVDGSQTIEKGLRPFSKDSAGRARLDCRLFTAAAEKVLGGIKDENGRPVFNFTRGTIVFKDTVIGHEILVAEIASPKSGIRRLIVSNGIVEQGEAKNLEDDLGISGSMALDLHAGSFASYTKAEPSRQIPFKFDENAFIENFSAYVNRLAKQVPFDTPDDVLPRFAATAIEAINAGEFDPTKMHVQYSAKLLGAIAKYAVDTRDLARRQEAALAAEKIVRGRRGIFGDYWAEYNLAALGILCGEGRRMRALRPQDPTDIYPEILKAMFDRSFVKSGEKMSPLGGEALARHLFTGDGLTPVGLLDLPHTVRDPVELLASYCDKDDLPQFYREVGLGFKLRGRHDEAAKYLSRALSIWPKSAEGRPELLKNAAQAAASAGDEEGARLILDSNKDVERLCKNDGDRKNLAWAYYYAGRPKEARKIVSSPNFHNDPDAIDIEVRCELAINGKSEKAFELADRFVTAVIEKYVIIKVNGNSYSVRQRGPYDGVRYARHMFRAAEINADLDRIETARSNLKAASSWDPYMDYSLDIMFGSGPETPSWSEDKCICSDGSEVGQCAEPADRACLSEEEIRRAQTFAGR